MKLDDDYARIMEILDAVKRRDWEDYFCILTDLEGEIESRLDEREEEPTDDE